MVVKEQRKILGIKIGYPLEDSQRQLIDSVVRDQNHSLRCQKSKHVDYDRFVPKLNQLKVRVDLPDATKDECRNFIHYLTRKLKDEKRKNDGENSPESKKKKKN